MLWVLVATLALATSAKPMVKRQHAHHELSHNGEVAPGQPATQREVLKAKLAAIEAELRDINDDYDDDETESNASTGNKKQAHVVCTDTNGGKNSDWEAAYDYGGEGCDVF